MGLNRDAFNTGQLLAAFEDVPRDVVQGTVDLLVNASAVSLLIIPGLVRVASGYRNSWVQRFINGVNRVLSPNAHDTYKSRFKRTTPSA